MHATKRDRRGAALASGAAVRPTSAATGEVEPVAEAERQRGSRAASAKGSPGRQLDRFAYPKALLRWQRRLTKTQLAVALALWNRQPRNGRSFHVGATMLGRDCGGVAPNHVSEAVQRLEALGLVRVVKRGDKRKQEANEYLVPEAPAEPSDRGG